MKKYLLYVSLALSSFNASAGNYDIKHEVEKLQAAAAMGSWFMFCEKSGQIEGENTFLLDAGKIAVGLVEFGGVSKQGVSDLAKEQSQLQMKKVMMGYKKSIDSGMTRGEALALECHVFSNGGE